VSEVLVRVEDGVGRITLNRPRAINALNLAMVRVIDAALAGWADDSTVRLVLLDGAGERGLCAGGDIRGLYDAACVGDMQLAQDFFRAEYRLNARIAGYPKPYVALMDGITMGGGIGLSAHGSHRVVTERSRLAMPEVGIGFVPDVGGTWLLGRVPGHMGVHAALTGGQFGAADAIECGLADVCVGSERVPALAVALANCVTGADVSACLAGFAIEPPPGKFAENASWIATCYAAERVEDIVSALAACPVAGARQAAADIAGKCPFSLKMTLRALRAARGYGRLEPCLELEYRLALACLARPDFREGVRAAVVDKDRHPRWSPDSLAGVTADMVDDAFAAPDFGGLGL
jgi:enoyl-CoA hydratase